MFKTGIISLLLMFSIAAFGQGTVRFEATADAKEVVKGNFFNISFTLYNAKGNNFRAPVFKDFDVLNGPNRSSSISIVNGNRSEKLTYSFLLRPKKEGKNRIPPARITVGRTEYKSNVVDITVVKGAAKRSLASGESIEPQVYVKLEIDTNRAYIGQQLILNYKLYTTVNVENYNILSAPKFEGFYPQNIRGYRSSSTKEVIDGVQYTTKVLKRTALFPQQTGNFKIEPVSIQIGLSTNTNRNRGFFSFREVKPFFTETNELDIIIKGLPDNEDVRGFTGGVGDYQITYNISDQNLSTTDAFSLYLDVVGDGDLKRVSAPTLTLPPSFEVYDPITKNENTFEQGGKIIGKKQFEYLILPKKEGTYNFSPTVSYFNVDSAAYQTLSTNPITLFVAQGKGSINLPSITETEELSDEIRYIKTGIQVSKPRGRIFGTPLYWTLIGTPLLSFIGFLFYVNVIKSKDEETEVERRRREAEKVAQANLSNAKAHMEAGDARKFYDDISKSYLGYVSNKLEIGTSEITKKSVAEKLGILKVSPELVERFMAILSRTEIALFAGKTEPETIKAFYVETLNVLSEVEQQISSK